MRSSLENKTVLIIGRPSGIAEAVTLAAREEGAQVVVAGRDAAKLTAAQGDHGIRQRRSTSRTTRLSNRWPNGWALSITS